MTAVSTRQEIVSYAESMGWEDVTTSPEDVVSTFQRGEEIVLLGSMYAYKPECDHIDFELHTEAAKQLFD